MINLFQPTIMPLKNRQIKYAVSFLLLSLIVTQRMISQQLNKDSIENLSYQSIEKHFSKAVFDTIADPLFARAYLKKAKQENDTLRIATAYYYFAKLFYAEKGLKYSDSIIQYTKNMKGHEKFPVQGYLKKGLNYEDLGKYKEALDQYLIALKYAKENKDTLTIAVLKINIALLQHSTNEDIEVLPAFRNYVSLLRERSDSIKDRDDYTGALFNLVIAYMDCEKFDSASYIIKEGMKRALEKGDTSSYARFFAHSGTNLYLQKKYRHALDTLLKVVDKYDLKSSYPYINKTIGNCYNELGNLEKACIYYSKADSFITITNRVTPWILEIYPPLIKYYDGKKDYEKQLYYTNTLLRFDSLLDAKREYISKNVAQKYDIPELLKSKEGLILKLENDKNKNRAILGITLLVCLLLIVIFIYHRRKIKTYKKRFDRLMTDIEKKQSAKIPETESLEENKNTQSKDLTIQDELVETVLRKLDEFEKLVKFAKKDYTLHLLAKEFKTNYVYLSKIIND
ncbi:MAG: hypothetical protein HC831_29930, partial [Chloroflexia bacterium]|nr:hypothetical protein [Chloroflexia bacterium]